MTIERPELASQVLDLLPEPNYGVNYQPDYREQILLTECLQSLLGTECVTSASDVERLNRELGAIATGENRPVIITGNCAEPCGANVSPMELAKRIMLEREVVQSSALGSHDPLWIHRGMGQNAKPRSSEFDNSIQGCKTLSYMGDAINGAGSQDRVADPRKMVIAAEQAVAITKHLSRMTNTHIRAAHEVLLLAYDHSFMTRDTESGKEYLLSCDLPWIGLRTNNPQGVHVEAMSGVENSIGVKLGPDTTPHLIVDLTRRLNGKTRPGKLVFMIRMGSEARQATQETIHAIKETCPESLILFDMHATTKTLDSGAKIRAVEDVVLEARHLAEICGYQGMKLHGLHLETIMDKSRLECVDSSDQLPTHPGNVDPQLNPGQLRRVLDELTLSLTREFAVYQ